MSNICHVVWDISQQSVWRRNIKCAKLIRVTFITLSVMAIKVLLLPTNTNTAKIREQIRYFKLSDERSVA